MVLPKDITIDEKDGKYYIIMHSDEIEFTSNDLTLDKAITIRDRMIGSSIKQGPTVIPIHAADIPPEIRQFFRL